jgi:hypothetical protein
VNGPTSLGQEQERQIARGRLVGRLLQRDDVLTTFSELEDDRRSRGLRLPWSLLSDDEQVIATIESLKETSLEAAAQEHSSLSAVIRTLELEEIGAGWLASDLRGAMLVWISERDRTNHPTDADIATLASEFNINAKLRASFAEDQLARQVGVKLTRSLGPTTVAPQWMADRATRLVESMIADGVVPAAQGDELRALVAEFMPVADTWSQGLLDAIESDVGRHLLDDVPLSAMPLNKGMATAKAHEAVDRWAKLAHGAVDASSGDPLPSGRMPDKRRATIARDVDLFYRARVGQESHRSLARLEFSDPDRTGEIRDRIANAERLLTLGDSEAT